MSTAPRTPPRSTSAQNASTTPYRRSMADLMEQLNSLFDSLPSSTSSARPESPLVSAFPSSSQTLLRPRTAPLRLLPDLFAAFEHKRGIEILNRQERDHLSQLVASLPAGMEEQLVGVDQVLELLVKMGVSGNDTPRQEQLSQPPQEPMLPVDPSSRPSDGSPIPRHRRTVSSASNSSRGSTTRSITPSSPSSRPTTPIARPSLIPAASPAARRRSLMSSLSRPSSLHSPGGAGGKTLRKKRTFEDLSNLIVQQGGKYLGVGLDGPTGNDWEAGELSLKVRSILSAKGPTRDRDLGLLLTPLTYSQLKSLDASYASHFGKALLDVLAQDKSFKGTVEFVTKGLLVGPLAWDVHLIQLALDADKVNDTLLIELLVGRSPSSLALLRAAYSHRSSLRSLSTLATSSSLGASPAHSSVSSKSLDVAVISAFSGGQLRLRKAWETALQGRWDDLPSTSDSSDEEEQQRAHEPLSQERRKKLLSEDLDQLKVALRRGGNTELASKILLARSPYHLGDLDQEYRKSTAGHSSLSKAIKQSVAAGTLQRMLLHVVEGGKKKSNKVVGGKEFEVTVFRDSKKLERAIVKLVAAEDIKGKDREAIKQDAKDELAWRLSRLHWERARFSSVQEAYEQKYRQSLGARLDSALAPCAIREVFASLVNSASLPEPVATLEDHQRLERPSSRARTISTESFASNSSDLLSVEEASPFVSSESEPEPEARRIKGYESGHSKSTSGSEVEAGDLEAQGEMSDPPSPRSPPPPALESETEDDHEELEAVLGNQSRGDSTPNVSSLSTFDSQSDLSSSTDRNESFLPRSTSALSFTSQDGSPSERHRTQRRPSSSLSNRSRAGGLPNLNTHRPPSSASGSVGDRSIASLRHSRPIAPSRAKRRQSEEVSNRERSASTEPLSPTDAHSFAARSPTPSGRPRSSLGRSTSNGSISLSTSQDASALYGSPGVDETSFHPAPLSPVGDVGPSSSSFSSAFPDLSPLPASPGFDLSGSSDLFNTANDSPGLRRHSSSGSIGGSRPSSLFGNNLFGTGHSRDGSLANPEQVQQLIQQVSDLQRKLKDAEGRLQASASAFEQDQSDLEARLEELRAELQTKRREEKELRNNEKQHLAQISSLEGDIAKLTKSLERSRENYDSMKRSYTETCEEAERLRALVAESRRENRAAEESIQGHALQVQQFERDRELLQQGINKLEEDLEVARKAQDNLDDQKQENLILKETIDRLRFDLDEMRTANRKSGFLDPSAVTSSPDKSLQASISRSLGRELATQLDANGEESESDGEDTEDDGRDEDEIIVTTHRRIKKRGRKNDAPSEPIVHHVESTVTVCDADIQTDAIARRNIEAQTDLSGIGVDLIVAPPPLPPVATPKPKSAKERKEEAAKELGVDLDLVKQYLETQKPSSQRLVELSAPSSPRRAAVGGRWRSRMLTGTVSQAPSLLISYFPTAARPYVGQVLDSGVTLMLYSATIFLFGILTGAHLLPVNHYHYLTPFTNVLPFYDAGAYNTMSWEGLVPGASGTAGMAREGLAQFFYELIWSGVQNARRVPI